MTAADEAYSLIRQSIANGAFKAGLHLKEEEMAAHTGLSRTPIRQALQRLHSEGWVTAVNNKGTFVRSFERRDVEESTQVRLLLEPYAAELAATRIEPAQIVRLQQLNAEMERAIDAEPAHLDRIERANREFHRMISQASGSRRLDVCLRGILETPIVFRTFSRYSKPQLQRSLAYHRELVAAFEARDAIWAKSVMTAHISAARHAFAAASD